MRLTIAKNAIFQILALAVQYQAQAVDLIPTKYKPVVAALLTLAQAAVALWAHGVNHDGTPQEIAFKK